MKLAQIQMHVTADKTANLRHAEELLYSVRGADMAILPEMFCCPYGEPEGGAAYQMLSRMARELGLWLVGGSLPELEGGRVYNTSFVFDPQGACVARHRKMHLFDIDVEGGQRFRESDTLSPGNDVTLFDTPWGRMGLCICFDLRFEELCRVMALEGARVLLAPAAFSCCCGSERWTTSASPWAPPRRGTRAPPMWHGAIPWSATRGARCCTGAAPERRQSSRSWIWTE